MRISDWSSDVCSSDLFVGEDRREARQQLPLRDDGPRQVPCLPIFALPGDAGGFGVGAEPGARKEEALAALAGSDMRHYRGNDTVLHPFERVGQFREIAIVHATEIVEIEKEPFCTGGVQP